MKHNQLTADSSEPGALVLVTHIPAGSSAKLEALLVDYAAAALNGTAADVDRLCEAVEAEAERLGYDNHRRLMAAHSFAETFGPAPESAP